MKPAIQAIRLGFESLNEVIELSGVSRQTLDNWSNNKPELFEVVLLGCITKKFGGIMFKKYYEWDIEELEDYDPVNDCQDIIDHHHAYKLKELTGMTDSLKNSALVLILDIGNDEQGLQERYWAYVVNDKLPTYFDNSDHKVPKRFHDELRRFQK